MIGAKVSLKDGRVGIIIKTGVPDFPGDPIPVYVQVGTEIVILTSDELVQTKDNNNHD